MLGQNIHYMTSDVNNGIALHEVNVCFANLFYTFKA